MARGEPKKADLNRDATQMIGYFKKHPFQAVVGVIIVFACAVYLYGPITEEINFSATGEPSSTSTSAEDVYASTPDSKESNDKILSFATGVWTFTEPSNLWWRYVISSNGNFTVQSAMPVQDSWGAISGKGHIKPTTGKFADTGQRWFGFDVITDNFMDQGPSRTDQFIIQSDGTLIEIDGGGNRTNTFKHVDASPFSK